MKTFKRINRPLTFFILIFLIMQTASCGYFIHPERRGQTGAKIDTQIAILDGLGLLLFIIPGVIAYAVDFSSGAIYLPGGEKSSSITPDNENVVVVQTDKDELNFQTINEIVKEHTGYTVDTASAQVYELDSVDEARKKVARFSKLTDYHAFNCSLR
ncbi:MAG: hypothetical protein JSV60_11540 [Desulfobacterales bacterium]|nr:MAG: hypothetical protein JSV60_11540 [Desulfobacterales bacterium]